MPTFDVSIPFAGYFSGRVDAENKEDAIRKAMEQCSFRVLTDDDSAFECGDVELLPYVCRGNVNYAPLSEAEVEEVHED